MCITMAKLETAPSMVAHAHNLGTYDARAGLSQIQGQIGIRYKTVLRKGGREERKKGGTEKKQVRRAGPAPCLCNTVELALVVKAHSSEPPLRV